MAAAWQIDQTAVTASSASAGVTTAGSHMHAVCTSIRVSDRKKCSS